jgi:tetratricopeptide (TPR) repeat protein
MDANTPKTSQLAPALVADAALGYFLEKALRPFYDRHLSGQAISGSDLRLPSLGLAALSHRGRTPSLSPAPSKTPISTKDLEDALNQSTAEPARGLPALRKLLSSENLRDLASAQKQRLAQTLRSSLDHPYAQEIALLLLRDAYQDQIALKSYVDALGGQESLARSLQGFSRGAWLALKEAHQIDAWNAPFLHPVFEEEAEAAPASLPPEIFEEEEAPPPKRRPRRFPWDRLAAVVEGRLAVSQLLEIPQEEMKKLMERAYFLLQQRKLQDAKALFEALVYLNPFESYTLQGLGSACQQSGLYAEACQCYSLALERKPDDLIALANRGESALQQKDIQQALYDFQRILALDPERKSPASGRVQALLSIHNDEIKRLLQADQSG